MQNVLGEFLWLVCWMGGRAVAGRCRAHKVGHRKKLGPGTAARACLSRGLGMCGGSDPITFKELEG